MSDTPTQKLVVFLDNIGRTILGEQNPEKSDDGQLAVKNPVILHVVPDQNQRMSVQLLPILFREFTASKEDDVEFYFKIANITKSDLVTIDFRLAAQYAQLFGKNNVFVPPSAPVEEKKVEKTVNLFDE